MPLKRLKRHIGLRKVYRGLLICLTSQLLTMMILVLTYGSYLNPDFRFPVHAVHYVSLVFEIIEIAGLVIYIKGAGEVSRFSPHARTARTFFILTLILSAARILMPILEIEIFSDATGVLSDYSSHATGIDMEALLTFLIFMLLSTVFEMVGEYNMSVGEMKLFHSSGGDSHVGKKAGRIPVLIIIAFSALALACAVLIGAVLAIYPPFAADRQTDVVIPYHYIAFIIPFGICFLFHIAVKAMIAWETRETWQAMEEVFSD